MKFCPTCQGTFEDRDLACPKDGTDLLSEVREMGSAAEDLLSRVLEKKYLLEAVLGTGGMGFVYRGRHLLLGRSVAIKVLRPDMVAVPELRKRFLREARAACETEHPGIVDVIDFGVTESGIYYLVMELLVGESLYLYLRRRGRLPFDEVAPLALDILEALGAVHGRGIVHRDVKPDNFVIQPAGSGKPQVRMVDFGLAKVFEEKPGEKPERITRGTVVMGSPQHMSPEQARGLALDERSDIYSVGCILYEMCTGRVPFVGETSVEIISKQLVEEVEPPSVHRQDISPGLEQIIMDCLAKDPEQRFASTADVAREILVEFPGAHNELAEPGLETLEPERADGVTTPDILNITERQTVPSGLKRRQKAARGMRFLGLFLLLAAMAAGFLVLEHVMSPQWELDETGPEASTEAPVIATKEEARPPVVPEPDPPAEARETAASVTVREPAPPVSVNILVKSRPAGASIVDAGGQVLGRTPLKITRVEGSPAVRLTVGKPGFKAHTVDVAFEKDREWDLRLRRVSTKKKIVPKKKKQKAGKKSPSGFMDPF